MNYRDVLDASKGCPKCCSKTLERFKKNTGAPANVPEIIPETKPEIPAKPVESNIVKNKKR